MYYKYLIGKDEKGNLIRFDIFLKLTNLPLRNRWVTLA